MNQSLLYKTPSIVIAIILLVAMMTLYYIGHRIKLKNAVETNEGLGAIEGSLLGLLALLLSFTFSMSSSRHDKRFDAIVSEANSIGTAILRADFFPDSERIEMRNYFKSYADARIAQYDAGNDFEKYNFAASQTDLIAGKLWKMAVKATNSSDITERTRGSMMSSSLNDMIDAITTRKASTAMTVPGSILWLLFVLCLAGSFINGYGSKTRPDFILVAGFAIMISITVFFILDLDRPYRGIITLNKAEENIVALKEMLR